MRASGFAHKILTLGVALGVSGLATVVPTLRALGFANIVALATAVLLTLSVFKVCK